MNKHKPKLQTHFRRTKTAVKMKTAKGNVIPLNRNSANRGSELWHDFRSFLDEIEKKVLEFGKLPTTERSRPKRTHKDSAHLSAPALGKTQKWISSQVDRLKDAEGHVQNLIDRASLQAHLGKMEAKDLVTDSVHRLDRLKERIDALVSKANSEAADGLTKLSEACLSLRKSFVK